MQAMSPGMHIQPITRSQDESSELCEVHCLAGFLCFWCLRLFGLMRRTCETTGGARLFSEGILQTLLSVFFFLNLSHFLFIHLSLMICMQVLDYRESSSSGLPGPGNCNCGYLAKGFVPIWQNLASGAPCVLVYVHACTRECVQCACAFLCNVRGHFEYGHVGAWVCKGRRLCGC